MPSDAEALALARSRFAPGGVLHEDIDALLLAEHDAKERAERAEGLIDRIAKAAGYFNMGPDLPPLDVAVGRLRERVSQAQRRHTEYLERMDTAIGTARPRRDTGEPATSDFDVVSGLRAEASGLRDENRRLAAEIGRLREELAIDRAVCICGCPPEDHEDGGEDGEQCAHEDHECLRVCVAARDLYVVARAAARTFVIEKSISVVSGLTGYDDHDIRAAIMEALK